MHVNEGHYVGTEEHNGNQRDEESNDVEYSDVDNVHSEEIGIEGGHKGSNHGEGGISGTMVGGSNGVVSFSNSDGTPSNVC